MKRSINALLFILITFLANNSQAQFLENLKTGFRIGPNVSSFAGEDRASWGLGEDPKLVPGFSAGVYAQHELNNGLIVESGLYLTRKGAKYEGMGYDISESATVDRTDRKILTGIDMPFMARYYVNEQISVFAGPQISFLVSAKNKIEEGGSKRKEDVNDSYKSVGLNFTLGAGYDFENSIHAQVNFTPGISNITKSEYEGISTFDVKDCIFWISIGCPFPLGGE
ncbi:porin family protein [Fulvivirgaceae bacterium BMA10]|uniref:Porin family protein n=1 Tax=Splendidivirga corallicola TaxID=3051826 RepID=A0ABT8KHS1_9BACT|nr:porin family protein [Fulvivirgaceae bacterium BMA10]